MGFISSSDPRLEESDIRSMTKARKSASRFKFTLKKENEEFYSR